MQPCSLCLAHLSYLPCCRLTPQTPRAALSSTPSSSRDASSPICGYCSLACNTVQAPPAVGTAACPAAPCHWALPRALANQDATLQPFWSCKVSAETAVMSSSDRSAPSHIEVPQMTVWLSAGLKTVYISTRKVAPGHHY